MAMTYVRILGNRPLNLLSQAVALVIILVYAYRCIQYKTKHEGGMNGGITGATLPNTGGDL